MPIKQTKFSKIDDIYENLIISILNKSHIMLKSLLLILSFFLVASSLSAQPNINVNNIDIVRSEYGIPHIFSKTDAEAVYGIAWAQCEDNFNVMQENFAATKGLSGRITGKLGALLDLLYQVFEIEEYVASRYEMDITPEIEALLQSYAAGVNRYAALHPKEVKHKKLFPITPKQIVGMYTLQYHLMHNSGMELGRLLTKKFDYELNKNLNRGSNAMAYSPKKTADEKTYLVGNPHQPVNTMGNFWEVSVHSEEGYEMFGATFSVGGLTPVIGSNRNLGWSHTTNYQNSSDVYKLEMHPTQKNIYNYDGKWLELEEEKVKLKVKIGPAIIPVTQKFYRSIYGPTFKKTKGYYSYKSHAFYNLKGPEQWYKMGKAKNINEFFEAINLQGVPSQTITYADKDEHIFHLSAFVHPMRDESFDWTKVLPGNTSGNNWNLEKVHPVSSNPQVVDPACGYVYNCNNTVFKMTAPEENLKPEDFPKSFHLLTSNTLRANTAARLIQEKEKISFEEARKIRENVTIDLKNLSFRNCMNCGDLPKIIAKYPELAEYKAIFEKWNGSYDVENKQAALFSVTVMNIGKYIRKQMGNMEQDVPEEVFVKAMLKAAKFLKKHHGGLEVDLGKVQKAVRGKSKYKVELPMYGNVNTLASASFIPYKKGMFKIDSGDSFLFYAKYSKDGLESMETINAFGNSMKPKHPNHTDQTEMYVKKQTKKLELDLEKLRQSGEAYHPQ